MSETREGPIVVAVVTEDGRFDHVRRRALELARERGGQIVLYDIDAGRRLLESPVPTNWSAEGEQEQFTERLDVSDLEALGRAPLAHLVRAARRDDVPAWGWLPQQGDAATLGEYAARQGATIVLVPDEERELVAGLEVPVEVVPTDPGDR